MTSKRHLIIAIVATFCLTASLFLIISSRSASEPPVGTYWSFADINDDGQINILDAIILSNHWNAIGTPMNKTALLDLQSQIDALNARLNALEANNSVTNQRLSPYAIPFNLSSTNLHNFTTETAGFVDMPSTSVTLTLNRTSQLLIMFSANAWMSNATYNPSAFINCQAVVNGTPATPSVVQLTPTMTAELGSPVTHAHRVTNSTCNFTFYSDLLNAGTYTIQIRWYVSQGQGDVATRTLAVTALPT